jgi:hypothetical protein
MVKENKKKPHYSGITSEEVRRKGESVILVNGVEVSSYEYLQDPKKYNSIPLDPAYVKHCEEHLQKSIATKAKLAVDPNTIKSII